MSRVRPPIVSYRAESEDWTGDRVRYWSDTGASLSAGTVVGGWITGTEHLFRVRWDLANAESHYWYAARELVPARG